MSMQKKFIVYLSALLAFCAILTGCEFSSFSESEDTNSSDTILYTAEASSSNELSEQCAEPSMTVAIAPTPTIPPAEATTIPIKAPSATRPTAVTSTITTPTIPATAKLSDIALDNLIGKSKACITEQFGSPVAIEKSKYGFSWHVYHDNYAGFFMVGIHNSSVVGLYSNSPTLRFENISAGTAKKIVSEKLYGRYSGPLTFIQKGNTKHILSRTEQMDVFVDDQKYVTIFYDNISGGKLVSIQIIDYSTEQNFGGMPAPDKGFADSYERISFYLINSTRKIFNRPILQYDDNMAKIAAAHSHDMLNRSFFSHINPDGLDFGEELVPRDTNTPFVPKILPRTAPAQFLRMKVI